MTDVKKDFKDLFFEICASFINLSPDRIDRELSEKLRKIGKFWSLDAVVLAEVSEKDGSLLTRHSYVAPGIDRPPAKLKAFRSPWVTGKLYRGERVVARCVSTDLPQDAAVDKKLLSAFGIRSFLLLPFMVEDAVRGGLVVLSYGKKAPWPDSLPNELAHISEVFAAAMDRKRAAERIAEAGRLERLLSAISATYINLPGRDVDNALWRDLARLGEMLMADRCVIYLREESGEAFRPYPHCVWGAENDPEKIRKMDEWVVKEGRFKKLEFLFKKWRNGEHFQWTQKDALPPGAEIMKSIHQRLGTKSHLSVPIAVVGKTVGAFVIADNHHYRRWPEEIIPWLRLFGEVFANAITRKHTEETLFRAFSEIKRLKRQVEADYTYLREEIKLEHNFDDIVGGSEVVKNMLRLVEQVAPTDVTVLIYGETGTGKELIARALHNASRRSHRPLVKLNCASLAPNLIESELFGHERGAFTGADARRIGRFELANGATIFLDEIGEMPVGLQAKLLRVLQEGEFERVGGSATIRTDVRVIAATNRNLRKEIDKGLFRRDLYYRLNTFPISVPPLRDRVEDIPLLVKNFVDKYSKKMGKPRGRVSRQGLDTLARYPFPGNIRELENMIERALITSSGGTLRIDVPPPQGAQQTFSAAMNMNEANRRHIEAALEETNWRIEGPRGAAHLLGLKPSTLRNRMRKLAIHRPDDRQPP